VSVLAGQEVMGACATALGIKSKLNTSSVHTSANIAVISFAGLAAVLLPDRIFYPLLITATG
jgi:hypothetical protein